MIKLLISDQDGTLYPSNIDGKVHPLINETRKKVKEWIINNSEITHEKIDEFYVNLQKKFPNPYNGFASLGLPLNTKIRRNDHKGIMGYHDVLDTINICDFLEPDPKLADIFQVLSESMSIYVATLSSPNIYSSKIQERLGVKEFIQETICPLDICSYYENISKRDIYQMIAKNEKVRFDEIIVLGDNYYNDIKPAIDLGCNVSLVNVSDNHYPEIPRLKIYDLKDCINGLNKIIYDSVDKNV